MAATTELFYVVDEKTGKILYRVPLSVGLVTLPHGVTAYKGPAKYIPDDIKDVIGAVRVELQNK